MQEVKTTKNAVKRAGMLLPKDEVTVYATEKLAGVFNVGDELTVHSNLAKKLIESGKATTTSESKNKKQKEETK